MTQRRFATLGNTLLKIAYKVTQNYALCEMLKYSDVRSTADKPTFNPNELINKNILLKPLLPDEETKESFLVILLPDIVENPENNDFKILSIRFDILVPFEDWDKIDDNLKPFSMLAEIDTLFNGARLNGIGVLKFESAELIVMGETLSGYTVLYTVDEFN